MRKILVYLLYYVGCFAWWLLERLENTKNLNWFVVFLFHINQKTLGWSAILDEQTCFLWGYIDSDHNG